MNFKPIVIDHANPPPKMTYGLFWHRSFGWVKGWVWENGVIAPGASHPLLADCTHMIPEPPPPGDPAWNEV